MHSAKCITWIYRLSLAEAVIHFVQPPMKITSHKYIKYPHGITFGPAVGILFALHFLVDFLQIYFLFFLFSAFSSVFILQIVLIVLYWWIYGFDALFLLLCIRKNSINKSMFNYSTLNGYCENGKRFPFGFHDRNHIHTKRYVRNHIAYCLLLSLLVENKT